jgi:hypothetical protein
MVERAARALYDHDWPDTLPENREKIWPLRRDDYLRKAQALADAGLLADPAEVWADGLGAGIDWMAAMATGASNGPPDPPRNPYETGA